jgi:glycyl-tRNA synthetase beta chain
LAKLRTPVDTFFEAVLVNDPDKAIRVNRLNLLARLRDTMHLVADFSKVSG